MKQSTDINIRNAYMYRHRPECVRVLADFYWRILLSLALVIALLSLVYGIHILSGVNESGLSQLTSIILPVPKFNKTQLQNTLTTFKDRESKFNYLKTAPQKIPDPSR